MTEIYKSEANSGYLGATFEVVGLRLPKPYVIFRVPCLIRDGEPTTMVQHLGKIKRKNDKRFVAFRSPNKSLFETYPEERIFEKVHSTIEEAQQWIIDGIPSNVDRSHINMLTAEQIETLIKEK